MRDLRVGDRVQVWQPENSFCRGHWQDATVTSVTDDGFETDTNVVFEAGEDETLHMNEWSDEDFEFGDEEFPERGWRFPEHWADCPMNELNHVETCPLHTGCEDCNRATDCLRVRAGEAQCTCND